MRRIHVEAEGGTGTAELLVGTLRMGSEKSSI